MSKKNNGDKIYEDIIAYFLNDRNEDEPSREKPKPTVRKVEKTSEKFKIPNLLPNWANKNDVHVRTYIDSIDEFLDNSHSDVSSFISSADNLEKSIMKLQPDKPTEKDIVISRLQSLQAVLNSSIKSLSNHRAVADETESEDDTFYRTPLSRSIATDLDKLETYSMKSYASSHNESNASYRIKYFEGDSVDCQFCNERLDNLQGYVFHIPKCRRLREKNFENFKRLPSTNFQLIIDIIKCNVCNMKFKDLSQKKRHEKSKTHARNADYRDKYAQNPIVSSYVYCNSCRVLIPDTSLQYQKHLQNREHVKILSNSLTFADMAQRGYHLVISRSNIIKCLVCPRTEFKCDLENLERHCKDRWHKVKKSEKTPTKHANSNEIYCENCDVPFELEMWDWHVSSGAHGRNVRNRSATAEMGMKNEYCIFCENAFPNLKQLAIHLESNDCIEMKMLNNKQYFEF